MSDMIPHCYVCHYHHYGDECPEARGEPGSLDRDAEEYHRDKRAGAAWLDINADILRVLLDLPDGTEIHDAIGGHDTVSLLVSSPGIHRSAMRVRAVYAGAFGGSNFSRWHVVAKREPSAVATSGLASVDTRRMAETPKSGSVRSTGSAVPTEGSADAHD